MNTYEWTRQLHDAIFPEAKENNMDVYHLIDIKYHALILPGPTMHKFNTQQIVFLNDKLRTMFVLKYGHLL